MCGPSHSPKHFPMLPLVMMSFLRYRESFQGFAVGIDELVKRESHVWWTHEWCRFGEPASNDQRLDPSKYTPKLPEPYRWRTYYCKIGWFAMESTGFRGSRIQHKRKGSIFFYPAPHVMFVFLVEGDPNDVCWCFTHWKVTRLFDFAWWLL